MAVISIDGSQRKAARIAGFLYLITFAVVVAANFGIADRLIVHGNPAATVQNIRAHETLFRINIAAFVIYSAGVVGLLSALYVALKPVSAGLALAASLFRFVFALIWLVAPLSMYLVLRVLSSQYLHVVGTGQLQALAQLAVGGGFEGYYIGLPFFGLASTLTFYLFFKSGYVPRLLGVVGAIASGWCVISALAFIAIPDFDKTMSLWWLDSAMGLSELALGFRLAFMGIKSPEVQALGARANMTTAGRENSQSSQSVKKKTSAQTASIATP